MQCLWVALRLALKIREVLEGPLASVRSMLPLSAKWLLIMFSSPPHAFCVTPSAKSFASRKYLQSFSRELEPFPRRYRLADAVRQQCYASGV